MSKTEKSILRLATYELIFEKFKKLTIINEHISIIDVFCGDANFANGILDNISRQLKWNSKMNEFDYIEKYFNPLTNEFAGNLKNDAAIFNQRSSFDLIISTDTLVEGIHFFGNENPSIIAKKSLRVNLSDMAAMGAKPVFYNLSLSLPKEKAKLFIPKFAKGLEEDQEIFNLKLIGGDLTSSLKHISSQSQFLEKLIIINPFLEMVLKMVIFCMIGIGLSKIGLENYFSN